jgi:hypothetical protein
MNKEIKQIQNNGWNLLSDHYTELLDAFRVWKVSNFRNENYTSLVNENEESPLNQLSIYFDDDQVVYEEISEIPVEEIEEIFSSIDIAISQRDSKNIYPLLKKAERSCKFLDVNYSSDLDDINEAVYLTKIQTASLIYLPPKPTIIIPRLILPVHSQLIDLIKNDPKMIFQISPREFEEIIAELFKARGFEIELTRQTRDGGRDIIAISEHLDIRSKYLIECKRYLPDNKVTISLVQRLYGVKMAESANKAILATTSSFTKPAKEFASEHIWDLDLKAYDDIMGWIKSYNYPGKPSII